MDEPADMGAPHLKTTRKKLMIDYSGFHLGILLLVVLATYHISEYKVYNAKWTINSNENKSYNVL